MPSLAGSFLVAKPTLRDPNFRKSVVLLLQHGPQGAFGLVVNNPSTVEGFPCPVFAGGPCESPGAILLHGREEWLDPGDDRETREVAPGVFLGDEDCFRRVSEGEEDASRCRLFAGYSGWGPDQLEGEMVTGSWAVVPATGELLFDTPVEELWDRLVPPSVPQPSVN
jgi:putative transcriptional regulator